MISPVERRTQVGLGSVAKAGPEAKARGESQWSRWFGQAREWDR